VENLSYDKNGGKNRGKTAKRKKKFISQTLKLSRDQARKEKESNTHEKKGGFGPARGEGEKESPREPRILFDVRPGKGRGGIPMYEKEGEGHACELNGEMRKKKERLSEIATPSWKSRSPPFTGKGGESHGKEKKNGFASGLGKRKKEGLPGREMAQKIKTKCLSENSSINFALSKKKGGRGGKPGGLKKGRGIALGKKPFL